MANANNTTGNISNVLTSQYLELLIKNNPGVYISEKNYNIYNITQNYNRLTLVIGSSRKGVANLPVLCVSPENFKEIYGDIDYLLESRNSFFHRTVLDMLPTSPVICLNLRTWDNDLDMYNWINLSTSSDSKNSNIRSNSIQDFYDTSNGFWQRSPDDFISIVDNNVPDANTNPLNFVNQGEKPVSILIFKSTIGGFDIPVEDWYNGQIPSYLHPKDFISDYMVQVIFVEGIWSNYTDLSNSPVWGRYFDNSGIILSQLEDFLVNPTVNLIKRYNVSLIPHFVDKNNTDMWIQTVINNDVNETGILCSFNSDIIETDYRNGLMDMNGDNLTKNKIPQINFLSYNRNMTDFYIIDETLLDSAGNSFGNNLFNKKGRTQIYCEGYVDGIGLKSKILSSTTNVTIKPFTNDGYGVINGVVIPISTDINDVIALNNILVPNSHRAYVIVLTSSGIQFRLGGIVNISDTLFLPQINSQTEIVLGYYELGQDNIGNYFSNFFPVTLNENGYISPFRQGNESISKISFKQTTYNWIQEIYFEDILNPNPQDYNQMRLYHLWYWLSKNLQEHSSLIMDTNGLKQSINWIEQGNDNVSRWMKIAVSDMTSDIYNTAGTQGMISYYIRDIEFLSKNNKWDYNKPPLSFGTRGIIGYESFIKTSYLNGFINSGDPFFWSFSEEEEVSFIYDEALNQNLIVIPNGFYNPLYYQKLVVIDGTQYNDGLWTFLEVINYNGVPAIVVKESVIDENVSIINLYDATNPYIINLYDINGITTAVVDIWDGNPYQLYQHLKYPKDVKSVWAKTLQIDSIISNNKIIVDWSKYSSILKLGYFLLSDRVALSNNPNEVVRNWTRILDLQKINDTQLLITTDSSIRWRLVDNVMETDILQPLWSWIDTLNFITLNGFKPRAEVFPDGTDIRMNELLNLIAPNTRMQQALATDRLEWRYLIDSFGGGLETESKSQLAQLCLLKQFALGIINVPSIKQFRKDGTKYSTNGSFDTKKLLAGGDRLNNIGDTYSLVNSGNGDTNVLYVSPFVSIFERGRTMFVPPASKIAQLYMRKHNDNLHKIWDAVAGILESKITTITGLEKTFTDTELIDMHTFGITCIANYNSLTYYMYNQRTAVAQQSMLQNAHCREALIELELSLLKGLREFQWTVIILENNKTKDDIEKLANNICNYYMLNNAISNYTNLFVVNNDFANAQLGELITTIELESVMQSIILQVNVLRNGTVSLTSG